MSIRAVIFDVYQTLLAVGPAPADRDIRWHELTKETFGAPVPLRLGEFVQLCDAVIAREHAAARAVGIPFPEIFWPDVVGAVMPPFRELPAAAQEGFILQQKALLHTVSLMPGVEHVLRLLRERGVPVGIASNAQPYTLCELARELAPTGIELAHFASDLCFWSFAHGFSKPDPHVFRLLTARLRARGLEPGEALMVGDRLDNDIAPARAQGWRTWRLMAVPAGEEGGDGTALGEFLARTV